MIIGYINSVSDLSTAARGVNAFVLKYRLQPTAGTLEAFETQMTQMFAAVAKPSADRITRPLLP